MTDSPDVQRAMMIRDLADNREEMVAINAKLDKMSDQLETLMKLYHSANTVGKLLTWIAGLLAATTALWAVMADHMGQPK
jgi:hypothetical protein